MQYSLYAPPLVLSSPPIGVINVSYIHQPSGTIQAVASPKVMQPVPTPPQTENYPPLPLPTNNHQPLGTIQAESVPVLQNGCPENGSQSSGQRQCVLKCATGHTLHSEGASITSNGIGKTRSRRSE